MQRPAKTSIPSEPDEGEITDALNDVLSSEKFLSAPQMSAFLRYVVEQAAKGRKSRIKAYTVAVDALGKPDTFDPQNDPVVRVLAGRLRASLATFYEAHPDAPLRIVMKPGSYVPNFVRKEQVSANQPLTDEEDDESDALQPTPQASKEIDQTTHYTDAQETTEHTNEPDAGDTALPAEAGRADTTTGSVLPPSIMDPVLRAVGSLTRFPVAGLIAGALLIGIPIAYQNSRDSTNEQPQQLASGTAAVHSPLERSRPDHVSIFVSAVDHGNTLKDQLNTLISGVFSESEDLRVYRMLNTSDQVVRWPEDYLVSLDVLSLPSETRVSIQLVEAQTGRISHSDTISLSEDAAQGLSREELADIMSFARNLISKEGPLFTDYQSKKSKTAN